MRFFETVNDFPDELLLEIFKHLPVNFLPIAQQVCKKWLQILNLGDAKTFRKEQHAFFDILKKYKFTSRELETSSTIILQSIYQASNELIHGKIFDLKEANEDLLNLMQEILSYYQLDKLNINLEDPNAFAVDESTLKNYFQKACNPQTINELNMRVEQLPYRNIRNHLKDALSRIKDLEKIFKNYYISESEKRDKIFLLITNIKLLKDFCFFLEEKNLQSQDKELREIVHYQRRNYYVDEVRSHTNIIACICIIFCFSTLGLAIYGMNELTDIKSVKELEKNGYTTSEAVEEHQSQTIRDIALMVTGFVLYCCCYFSIFLIDCYKNKSSEKIQDYSINYLKGIKSLAENRVEEIPDETTPLNPEANKNSMV